VELLSLVDRLNNWGIRNGEQAESCCADRKVRATCHRESALKESLRRPFHITCLPLRLQSFRTSIPQVQRSEAQLDSGRRRDHR
jgi:hypothetical protein